jgi:murein DD-endopeptidase MepM/ murein hydrolase activator NlpD
MTEIMKKAQAFIDENGGNNFEAVSFRPGASSSDPFGLTERYKIVNGQNIWGYPGIHSGTDRGKSSILIENTPNPVISPFDFVSSSIMDDGGRMYGTVVSLVHESGFVIKICHMRPEEIKVLSLLQSKKSISKGTLIGSANMYGYSFGIHTHTEIESYSGNNYTNSSAFLDAILEIKYPHDYNIELNTKDVIDIYKKCEKTINWKEDKCISDYKDIRRNKGILFLNKYKYILNNGSYMFTRYGTKPLFDM